MPFHGPLLRCAALLALCFPFLSATPTVAQAPPAKVALLAGVDQYEKRYFADRPLQFAERDVDHMSAELMKHGFNVKLLKGSLTGNSRATKDNINAALQEILKGSSSSDIILIGFAGHGQQLPLRSDKGEVFVDGAGKQMEDAYFCPVDAVLTEPDSMVSLTKLIQTLDVKGGVNLVLVDACRDNADPARGVRSISGNELNGRLPRNTALLFSCAADQQALETNLAGGGHGVFFHHVLRGLQGEAKNTRGEVTWSRLVEYVGENTNSQAKEWFPERVERAVNGRLQTPHELRNLIENPVLAKVAIAPAVVPPVNSNSAPRNIPPSNNNSPGSGAADGGRQPSYSLHEITSSIGLKLKLVPAGEFVMGSPANEKERHESEGPQHRVKITEPFYLGIHEVTKGQFAQFVNSTAYKTDAENDGMGGYGLNASGSFEQDPKYTWRNAEFSQGDDHPVVNVSWNDAIAFCEWLSKTDGATYKLPTEAQWEYACRAGTSTPFHFGSVNNGKQANINGNYPYGTETKGPYLKRTTSVGSYQANKFGLYDMHGNVWEWCLDGYDENAFKNRDGLTSDPVNSSIGRRVQRGGSWHYYAWSTRSAYRYKFAPGNRYSNGGFRVVRVVDAPNAIPPVNPARQEVNSPPSKNAASLPEITSSIGMKLKLIPAGEFLMGSPKSEIDVILAADNTESRGQYVAEQPQHRVKISKPFYMGIHEVTQAEYKAVMGNNPSGFSPTGGFKAKVSGMNTDQFPVERVSYFDAIEFCNKLSVRERLTTYYTVAGIERDAMTKSIKAANVDVNEGANGYRLPTEAQWEYACRAGTTTPFHFGRVNNGKEANINGNNPYGTEMKGPNLERTTVVGSYNANDFGLFDMHGNVWEWCFDGYDANAYKNRGKLTIDPVNSAIVDRRVLHGGTWYGSGAKAARSANRVGYSPATRSNNFGFRVLRPE